MCIFFFKQKTAYEMRISDWSSDVCSSDLVRAEAQQVVTQRPLEVQARRLAFVVPAADTAVARVAAFLDGRRAEESVVGAVAADDAARTVPGAAADGAARSEEHTSELQSLMRHSYAVFCFTKQKTSET